MKNNIESCTSSLWRLIANFFWYLLPDFFIGTIRWAAIILIVIATAKAIVPTQVTILNPFSPLVLFAIGGMTIMISTTDWKLYKSIREKSLLFFYRTGITFTLIFGIAFIYRIIKSAIHLDVNWKLIGINLLLLIIATVVTIIFGIQRNDS